VTTAANLNEISNLEEVLDSVDEPVKVNHVRRMKVSIAN